VDEADRATLRDCLEKPARDFQVHPLRQFGIGLGSPAGEGRQMHNATHAIQQGRKVLYFRKIRFDALRAAHLDRSINQSQRRARSHRTSYKRSANEAAGARDESQHAPSLTPARR
jgi:hypothetical protein